MIIIMIIVMLVMIMIILIIMIMMMMMMMMIMIIVTEGRKTSAGCRVFADFYFNVEMQIRNSLQALLSFTVASHL